MRLRIACLLIAALLVVAACGDDDAEPGAALTVGQAWCVGFADGIEASVALGEGPELEAQLEDALVGCIEQEWSSIADPAAPYLQLVTDDTLSSAYCRGRIAGDLSVVFNQETQLAALNACLSAESFADEDAVGRAERVFSE